MQKIFQIISEKPGPTSMILVGVHGDEQCGVEAIEELLPNLAISRGRLMIGYGNPRAIAANQRFIDANLNRMFKSEALLSQQEKKGYEYQRAQFLKQYFDQNEALLDIHASRTPASKPFVICESNSREIIKYLPVNLVVSGFDQYEPGGTDYYMNNSGKIGICIECGFLKDPQSKRIARDSILAFLKIRKHLDDVNSDLVIQQQSYVQINNLYITKTNRFNLIKSFDDFEVVTCGQIIGFDGDKVIKASQDGIILFARNRAKVGEEAFLFGETKNSLT